MSSVGYLDAVVLGVVEGLTEFLPVSSTGHLTVAEGLLGLKIDDPAVTSFTAIIQFGAIVATFLYFRQDFVRLALAWLRGIGPARGRHWSPDPDYRFAWLVILGSTPIVLVALAAKDLVDGPLRNLWVVAGSLIAWSAVIWWAERNPRQKYEETELGVKQVLIIGLMQCVALVPGVSRSGATISAGLMVGATRVAATRLSFFLAVPALTGAGVYSLKDVDTSVVGWGQLAVGTFVSFVVAYGVIAWLLKLVAGHSIAVFNPYRIVAGLAVMGLLATGVLSST
ncbi:undecaprenyl-diphosphate phosphatase [Kineosporia sp. J2-2]|uniref:Undecaprenyl-diphosphatase n=1 Tax=Kineosporia corallincola TaxID=2835133 RepID=A0ABS5TLD8_9ACTN|nr:undecaprenyl-diphosphate phosphatase [Kineosporia corallincola]MBT0771920.1 undecaprenyl-diphosphate phosphatase [Kineosporia corallincola]